MAKIEKVQKDKQQCEKIKTLDLRPWKSAAGFNDPQNRG